MNQLVKIYLRIISHEIITLVLLLVIAGGVWGIFLIADEVMEGDSRRLGETILLSTRTASDPSDLIGPSWFEETGREVTSLGSVVALAVFIMTMTGLTIL